MNLPVFLLAALGVRAAAPSSQAEAWARDASALKGTSAQVIVAVGVGAEGALHARAPRRRNSEARSWLGQAHVAVACFGVPSGVGATSPDPQRHALGCAEVPKGSAVSGPPFRVGTSGRPSHSLIDTVPPYLAFPEPGLDDPAAYEGYQTRVYQDASGNAFQVYVKSSGRVVNLWADAANESVGFSVRDSSGKPAELAWGSSGAAVERSPAGRTRSVAYDLEAPSMVRIGLFLLGSMRVERDFGYGQRDSLPLDAQPFVQRELTELIDHIAKLKGAERSRHLALLGVKSVEALRGRLAPQITLQRGDTVWTVAIDQPSFDGKTHLWLSLQGDTRETVPAVSGNVVTIRRPAGGAVRWSVRVTTDAAALMPLTRKEIFNDDFDRFAARVRADTAHPLL